MNELVIEAWKTRKEGSPKSGDIIKSAAVLKGEVVPYAAAYRILMQESQLSKKQATKGCKLIIPYLDNLTKKNPDFVVGYECDQNDCLLFPIANSVDFLCVKHIEANIRQRFGAECATYVFRIARTFSIRQQQPSMEKVHKVKAGAALYLGNIDGQWKTHRG